MSAVSEFCKHWRNAFCACLYSRRAGHASFEFSANRLLCHVFRVPTSPGNTQQRWSRTLAIVCGGGGRSSHITFCLPLRTCSGESHVYAFVCALIGRLSDLHLESKQNCEILTLVGFSLSTCMKSQWPMTSLNKHTVSLMQFNASNNFIWDPFVKPIYNVTSL